VSRSPDLDPAHAVAQPISRALDSVIIGAVASFALAIATVLTAVLTPDGPLHEIAHFGLVGVMGFAVVVRAIHVMGRHATVDPDAWTQARAVHRWDTDLALVLTIAVPLAWLAGSITIVVHHIPALHGPSLVLGALMPVAATLWILASFAWHDFCRDRIAAALDESNRRYRQYWRDLTHPS
jgi:hypothetical protein